LANFSGAREKKRKRKEDAALFSSFFLENGLSPFTEKKGGIHLFWIE
jgi:hypothetical protein